MVKEEYNKFLEQDMPDMPDMPQPSAGMEDPTIAVSDNDIDLDGGENPEETLRSIYDMLKAYFESGATAITPAAPAAACGSETPRARQEPARRSPRPPHRRSPRARQKAR